MCDCRFGSVLRGAVQSRRPPPRLAGCAKHTPNKRPRGNPKTPGDRFAIKVLTKTELIPSPHLALPAPPHPTPHTRTHKPRGLNPRRPLCNQGADQDRARAQKHGGERDKRAQHPGHGAAVVLIFCLPVCWLDRPSLQALPLAFCRACLILLPVVSAGCCVHRLALAWPAAPSVESVTPRV